MTAFVYILFLVPLILFVSAFLYETFLSFARLRNPKAGKTGYVHATWEVTHTLLIFTLVVLLMMFTKSIDAISTAVFTTTFLAGAALTVRSVTYMYIFYVRKRATTSWIDWLFALSHVVAALFLVLTVIKALWFLLRERPEYNSQFLPYFIPGLIVVLALCALPIVVLYRIKD